MVGDPVLGQCFCSRYKGKVNPVQGIHTGTRQGSFDEQQFKSRIIVKCVLQSAVSTSVGGLCVMAQSRGLISDSGILDSFRDSNIHRDRGTIITSNSNLYCSLDPVLMYICFPSLQL